MNCSPTDVEHRFLKSTTYLWGSRAPFNQPWLKWGILWLDAPRMRKWKGGTYFLFSIPPGVEALITTVGRCYRVQSRRHISMPGRVKRLNVLAKFHPNLANGFIGLFLFAPFLAYSTITRVSSFVLPLLPPSSIFISLAFTIKRGNESPSQRKRKVEQRANSLKSLEDVILGFVI